MPMAQDQSLDLYKIKAEGATVTGIWLSSSNKFARILKNMKEVYCVNSFRILMVFLRGTKKIQLAQVWSLVKILFQENKSMYKIFSSCNFRNCIEKERERERERERASEREVAKWKSLVLEYLPLHFLTITLLFIHIRCELYNGWEDILCISKTRYDIIFSRDLLVFVSQHCMRCQGMGSTLCRSRLVGDNEGFTCWASFNIKKPTDGAALIWKSRLMVQL